LSDNKDNNAFEDEEVETEKTDLPDNESVTENESETVSDSYEGENLDKELEELRDVFQQELDKATAEVQNAETDSSEENEEINSENLCLCCGEKERMEGSDYCEDCYEAMRHYPFKWVYFLVAILAVYVAVLAVGKIADINHGWVYAYEGDTLAEAGWYEDAADKYQYAQNYLYRAKVEPKMVYLHNLQNSFKLGGFNVINSYPTSVATLFDEWEMNLPHMKTLKQYYMKSQEMAATIQTVNDEIFSEYSEMPTSELPYDEIIKKINELSNRTLHIGIDENGNEITEEATTEQAGQMSSSSEVYFKRTTTYDKAMLEYFKYYFAATCGKSSEEKIGFLENVKSNAPEMIWLYAGELGMEYAENGNKEKALELADLINRESETDVVSYYIKALVAKIIDNDFEKAIEYCEQGNGYAENYEFYRQMALNYLALGDYKKAQENAQKAYDMSNDLTTINTLAFSALANGDSKKFDEMEKVFTDYNADVESDDQKLDFVSGVLALKNKEKTVDEILKQGGYDLND
jgi:tetratricopeptide (TPR) repeat protein